MARDIVIDRLTPEGAAHVVENIRLIDRREIYYLTTLTPEAALRYTLAFAVGNWEVRRDGVPVVIFGVNRRSSLSNVGVPWMVATDEIERAPLAIWHKSREYFERIARAFPLLENHVLAENRPSAIWLRWLGFDMQEPAPYGAFGASFIRFGRNLDQCV